MTRTTRTADEDDEENHDDDEVDDNYSREVGISLNLGGDPMAPGVLTTS